VKGRADWASALTLAFVLLTWHASSHTAAQSASASATTAVAQLQHDIDAILTKPEAATMSWGILVRSLASDEVLFAINPAKLMMPASTLKVLTLATAAERLGWEYTYETRIVADGTIRGDTLDGNLVIVGGGDPSLVRETLDAWTAQITRLGITKITGTVLADARAFVGEGLGAGWSWDDLAYYYAAPIAAAQFRENAVDLILRPGAAPGSPVLYELRPAAISGLRIENRVTTGPASASPEFVARRAAGSPDLIIEGVVPARSRPVTHALSVHDPVHLLAAAFADALVAGGIAVGTPPPADAHIDLPENGTATPLVTHRSASLRVMSQHFMNVSQNQYAETFVKTIGARVGTATFDGGLKVMESTLVSWGVPADGFVLRDGSGLSRYNYTTPDTLVQVLAHMYRGPRHREPFRAALSVAGRPGRMAGRMRETPAAGNARTKDGAMASVRTLCGFVNTADGEPLAFAILANGFVAPAPPAVAAAIDDIVVQLARFKR
jgi:D-alanyl-D-alanine carboxypeptidase/D-alanyl-D-alanine-endopeptidase (penicillin-binding protein 4)